MLSSAKRGVGREPQSNEFVQVSGLYSNGKLNHAIRHFALNSAHNKSCNGSAKHHDADTHF
jgi:hypothetical protein